MTSVDWRPSLRRDIWRAVLVNSKSRWLPAPASAIAAAFAALFMALAPRVARADVSSWFALGGGAASLAQGQDPTRYPAALQIEAGVGSPPSAAVIVGGIAKTFTYFGHGTDLALAIRGATGGFVRGDFGLAIDAGVYHRAWGIGSDGFIGALVLGAPFGLQLSAVVERGSNDVQTFGGILGIDFLRLTVYRTSLGSYWRNSQVPKPVDGR